MKRYSTVFFFLLSSTFLFSVYLVDLPFVQAQEFNPPTEPEETSVTICHYPPGNPDNSHTISVGTSAVTTHLDHGDYIGACAEILSDEPEPEPMVEPKPIETSCYDATLELDQNQYFLSDYYHVILVAPNKNHNSDAVETASIMYWEVGKSKGGMALEETGFDTGIFTTEGVNDRLTAYQISSHVESAPSQFMISFYDTCTGNFIEVEAEILSGDGPVVEHEPIETKCYGGATIEFDQDLYVLSDYYYVTVVSPDENRDSDAVETASVLYWAEGMNKGGGTLEETGTDTGIFTNSGVNDRLYPYQLSRHVESTPAYFLMSYYDACTGNTVQDHARVFSDDPELIEVPTGADIVIPPGASVPGCEETSQCFFPYQDTIIVGKTVMWFNQDSEWHTVTAGTPEEGPNGLFDSGKIENGQTFELTFTQPGTYPYFDMVHPWAIGEIIVFGSVTSSSDTTLPHVIVPSDITIDAGTSSSDITPPHVIVPSDMTIDAGTADSVKIEYSVKAIDDVDGIITPTCDVGSGSVVSVGQWHVTCTATDSAGNTGSRSFMITINSSGPVITDWVKYVADFWCNDEIEDLGFIGAIEYLIENGIIKVEATSSGSESFKSIPDWIKNNACWWAEGLIGDDDFVKGNEYLVKEGIIKI